LRRLRRSKLTIRFSAGDSGRDERNHRLIPRSVGRIRETRETGTNFTSYSSHGRSAESNFPADVETNFTSPSGTAPQVATFPSGHEERYQHLPLSESFTSSEAHGLIFSVLLLLLLLGMFPSEAAPREGVPICLNYSHLSSTVLVFLISYLRNYRVTFTIFLPPTTL
jgi:hypothetical protein